MILDCTALILAGGLSTRMGQDKTRFELDGKSLLQRAIEAMQSLFPSVLVSVRTLREDLLVPQVEDEMPGGGPLAGVCSGLAHAQTPWVFAVAADMPFLDAAMVASLAARRDECQAVVPIINGFPQPLTAFYRCAARPVFQNVLSSSGRRGVRDVLERLDVRWVAEAELREIDPGLHSFVDLDTPSDLALIERLLPRAK